MTLYIDTSALLKIYLGQAEGPQCEGILESDPAWFTARHTRVEVRRNLARALSGSFVREAQSTFERHWARMDVIELDAATCDIAVQLAETTGVRTLDALHLAAAHRIPVTFRFLTYDRRQADVSRSLGWTVLGA